MSVLLWLSLCLNAPPSGDQLDDQNVRDVVREVLADPDFRRLHRKESAGDVSEELPIWLRLFIEWLFKSDEEDATESVRGPPIDLSGVLNVLAILALAGTVTYLIVSMSRRLGSAERFDLPDIADDEALNPTAPPGELPSSEYERRALAYAERGDFRSALRELVLGTMSWIERAEMIRYRRGLTNRDYVRAVWREPPQRESMLLIVESFELVFFGRRLADSPRFDRALTEFRSSFGKEAAHAQMAN